jgi:uncharacterized protein (DUF1800 family)
MALTPLQGTLGIKRAAHLLRRATFGATKEQIDTFAGLTAAEAIAILFDDSIPDAPLPLDPATGQEWVISGTTDANSEESALQDYFKGWFLGQILRRSDLAEEHQVAYNVREKITLFFHIHFTTMQSKVNNSRSLYFQNQLFRTFAFDKQVTVDPLIPDQDLKEWRNFKELAKKICVDNAMLRFLDGRLNVKGNPNENFGRELLELYTIGRGLEGTLPEGGEQGDYFNYTEQDVQEGARVLSGFTTDDNFSNIDEDTMLPRGVVRGGIIASGHDNDPKEFSGRLDNQIIEPDPLLLQGDEPTEASALDEISQLVDLIFSKDEAARYICRRLYRYFIYHEIGAEVDENIITPMAETFIANGYRIYPVLEQLFSSEQFYGGAAGYPDDNFGAIIKSPLDLAANTIRFFEVPFPEYESDLENFYEFTDTIFRSMGLMGMNFYEPFEVAGYSAYHQYPIYNRNWISTNYLTRRYEFIQQSLGMESMMDPEQPGMDMLNFLKSKFPTIGENARDLIKELTKYLLPVHENLEYDDALDDSSEITAERINYFLFAFLYSPEFDAEPEAAWSSRWSNLSERELLEGQVQNLMNAMLQSPEYQLA